MTTSGRKLVDAQVYAFFAAMLVVLMLLFGFFVDSANIEQRNLVKAELSLVARETAQVAERMLREKDFSRLREVLGEIQSDHELAYLSVSDVRNAIILSLPEGRQPASNPLQTLSLMLPLGPDDARLGSLVLEKDLVKTSELQSIGSHLVMSLGALLALVLAAWIGLRFFVITRRSKDANHPLPFSTLASIASPFLKSDHPEFAALRPDQVAAVVRQSGFTMALVLANGAFLVGSVWSQVPHWVLVSWAVFVGALATASLRVWLRNRNRPLPAAVSKAALRRMTYHSGLMGLAWGIALSVFFVSVDTNSRFILIALGLGMAAGGTATLASVPSAALAFTGAILVPALLRFATLEGDGFTTLAILCILYAGSMGAFLGQSYHGFARNVLVRQAQERQAETIALVLNTYEEQASDWLWETDSAGRLKSPPGRMEFLFGCQAGTLANTRLIGLSPKGGDEGWPEFCTAFREAESFRSLVVRATDIEGQDRWISLSGRKREDGGWHGVGSDVTVRETALIQLRDAMEEAKSASRATTAFLAATSHELRTPLNAIIGFSQLLTSIEVPKETAKDYLETINGAGTHLLNIVNGILEMAQIEAGHKTLRYEEVDVAAVTQEAVVFLSLQAQTAGVALRFTPPMPVQAIEADRQALRQVLLNVIGNALKFTPEGGAVDIEITGGVDDIRMTISDTGIGIAPEDVDRVLKPFAQADDRLERRYEGTGLGLPIAKSLIELHRGALSIESDAGKGTTVSIVLPRSAAVSPQLARVN
ncbi:sensor histidine kinase [Denitrobaculum tricleocarpae]|nr:HAMP domain-containing sensor histidine kinase [Denitrobaculum tricleocarpae]